MRLVFMGTPDFAAVILKGLIEAKHDIACVYSQPPRPAGRGHKHQPTPVQLLAESHRIEVRTPVSLKSPEEQAAYADLKADLGVVAAYGLILPKPILEAPKLGCLNVHASLLPRWRGAAPIQRAILAGDLETGICIMRMDAGFDTGPVLMRQSLPIGPEATAGILHDRLAELGARMMLETIEKIHELKAIPQPDDGVTYAKKIEREESRIDWNRPACEIERLVRAMAPHPGAWFAYAGERFKLLKAEAVEERKGTPGTLLDTHLTVACAENALRILSIQRQGKAAMDAGAFLRGCALSPGTVLT